MVRAAIFSIFYLIFSFAPAQAQFADVLSVELSTPSIQKGAEVTLTATSPSLALETAMIVWKLDDKEVARGIGKTEYALTIVDTKPHEVTVTATERDGVTRTERLQIQANDIDILWEADTLTPPTYAGRSLPTQESLVRVEAITHGTKNISPQTQIYTWQLDGQTLSKSSGVGKNTLAVRFPTFKKTMLVGVSVETVAGVFMGKTQVRINAAAPFVQLYEKKPLIGLWTNTTIAYSTMVAEGIVVSAFPYFFSVQSPRDPALSYTWNIPKKSREAESSNPSTPASDVLLLDTAPFSVRVINKNTLLQEARTESALRSVSDTTEGENLFGM